ncbi:AAA family ATPase [Lysobacter sp. BMK333-48F3]|uniref:AAA family ATPase n=1 Tax=Lysobacter sp. BMK333-48F3 TaxID=2867962 RepID=UPI001C8CD506|nr:AAA family ATPase [Lysobacter sp. BMK333-48F3]MBX9402961.1 AAA family ATPase [Lysobacter sp. BMK333-48F3]
MQRFDRGTEPPPWILRQSQADQERLIVGEYLYFNEEKRRQTSPPRLALDLEHTSMTDALRRLFRGKCAFCESATPTSVHRFRPPGEALPHYDSPDAHLYYLWLAHAWNNFYPICADCRPTEPHYFPVKRSRRAPLPRQPEFDAYVLDSIGIWRAPPDESPLLLDPCSTYNFHNSLGVSLDGQLLGISPSGRQTVAHFRLDRFDLIETRQRHLMLLVDRLLDQIQARGPAHSVNAQKNPRFIELFDFQNMEFGGVWYLLLRRIARAVLKAANRKPATALSPAAIHRFYMDAYGRSDMPEQFESAIDRLDALVPIHPVELKQVARRTSAQRIAGIELQHFKSIRSLDVAMPPAPTPSEGPEDERAPALLILGENSAGKSSLLEAIALTLADSDARKGLKLLPDAFVLRPEQLGGDHWHTPNYAQVRIRLSEGDTRTLTLHADGTAQGPEPGADLTPVFAYGAFRQFQQSVSAYRPERYVRNLFHGNVLDNPESWLKNLDESKFAMAIRALRPILSVEDEFEVIERSGATGCQVVTGGNGAPLTRTPLSAVSSGYRSVLAMVCDIMKGLMDKRVYPNFESLASARGVILIDEIEAHLHPRWKMRIMRSLRAALPQMTFIATTHDPLCLRGMEDGEVIVLQRVTVEGARLGEPQVRVEALGADDLPKLSELRVEQLLTSDLFQLHSTDSSDLDLQMAKVADLLARHKDGGVLLPQEAEAVGAFRRDIASALPVGSSEAHRLVQEAVAEYLTQRRAASALRLRALREETKRRIIDILGAA